MLDRITARRVLISQGILYPDDEHLYRVDEDSFIYQDWDRSIQYTVTEIYDADGASTGCAVAQLTFAQVTETMNADRYGLAEETDEYDLMVAFDICPECGMVEEGCICL